MSSKSNSSENNTLLSPLRFPGSKRRLVGYIKDTLAINKIEPSLYIEPFIGGGSVALQLLNDSLIEKAIIMDVDPWIASFWQTVFFDTNWLIDLIQNIDVNLENWYKFKKANPKKTRDQAMTCFYLNRTSFSGILESRVGPIGGKNQRSNYKIDCRFSKDNLISRIQKAAELKEKVYGVWNCSWDEGMQKIRTEQKEGKLTKTNLFYYLDPPFFEEADALYRYYFLEQDHINLRNFLLNLQDKWLLSYDSAEQVQALYGDALKKGMNGTQHHDFELLYTVAQVSKRKKGKEVIISNLEHLPIPPTVNERGKK